MTAAVPDPRPCACGHSQTAHPVPTDCVRCTCTDYLPAVPDPRFRDQLAEANPLLVEVFRYYDERRAMDNPKDWAHVLRVLDRATSAGAELVRGVAVSQAQLDEARAVLNRLIEVEARVQAANQRVAEELRAAALDVDGTDTPGYVRAKLRARAAALTSPAPALDAEAGR
jgi:hypothetical protein